MALIARNYAWVGMTDEELKLNVSAAGLTITSPLPPATLTITYDDTIVDLKIAIDEFMRAKGWQFI